MHTDIAFWLTHAFLILEVAFLIWLDVKKVGLLNEYVRGTEVVEQAVLNNEKQFEETALLILKHISRLQDEFVSSLEQHDSKCSALHSSAHADTDTK